MPPEDLLIFSVSLERFSSDFARSLMRRAGSGSFERRLAYDYEFLSSIKIFVTFSLRHGPSQKNDPDGERRGEPGRERIGSHLTTQHLRQV